MDLERNQRQWADEKPGTRSQFELVLCGIQGFSGPLFQMLQHGSRPLPNPRLAEIVASLNLDFFQLPAKTVPASDGSRKTGDNWEKIAQH